MTAKSYSVEYQRQGPSGLKQVVAHVYDASTGDTLNFRPDFARVESAAILQRSNGIIQISVLAVSIVCVASLVCLPAGASLVGDDFTIAITGPAISSTA